MFCLDTRENSQPSEEHGSMVILDTLNAILLFQTAAELDCCVDTAFNMRHKLDILLERLIFEQDEVMVGIDATYVPDSYSGVKPTWIIKKSV